MTRFMMSLKDAVNLVLFALVKGNQGSTYIQKSPACTIKTLVDALLRIFDKKNEIITIGTRHGEKKHETLMSREENSKAIEYPNYFEILLDDRNLNYDKYVVDGIKEMSDFNDYTSENTRRLDMKEAIVLLLQTEEMEDYLK